MRWWWEAGNLADSSFGNGEGGRTDQEYAFKMAEVRFEIEYL